MRIFLPTVLTLGLALAGSRSSGEEATMGPFLDLRHAIELSQSNSPELAQLQAQYQSAVQKTWGAIAPSEPTLTILENDMTSRLNLGSAASKVVQVQQSIGFPGRAFLNRSMLSDQAEALNEQLRAMRLQISTNVKTAYYNLQLAQNNIALNSDTRLAFERIMEVARRRYESGATAQVDFLNAQVALLTNANELEDLRAAETVARAQLNLLLKQDLEAPLNVRPVERIHFAPVDLKSAAERMVHQRGEIRSAQVSQSAAEKAYKLAWMSVLPDFQFTFGTTEYRLPAASPYSGAPEYAALQDWPRRTYMAGVQITIPIWFLFNERAAISGASYDRAAAERNVDVVLNQSKIALKLAVETLNSTEKKIDNFEKHILPISDQALKLAMIDYSSGRVDFQTLADTAAARRQARLNYAQALVSYLTTYAGYGQLIGEEL